MLASHRFTQSARTVSRRPGPRTHAATQPSVASVSRWILLAAGALTLTISAQLARGQDSARTYQANLAA